MYLVDSRYHGESGKTDKISYDLMRDNIILFIKALKIQKPIIYGFSDGVITALEIAFKEPELVSKIILSGVNTKTEGLKKWVIINELNILKAPKRFNY